MSEFLKSNNALDDAVNGSGSFEDLRERLKATLADQGVITRHREDANYGARLVPGQQHMGGDDISLSASGYRFEREIRFAESTGKRALVIRANTVADLDALERQLTR